MVRLLVDDVTLHKTDRIHLHVRFRGGQTTSLVVAIPPKAWQARQTHPDTLAALDRLLDTHTDAQTAERAQRRRSPLRRGQAVHRPHRARQRAAATTCPATPTGSAPKACSPTTETRRNGSACTPAPSRAGPSAGILNSHKANDKNERLYEPPTPGDPRLTARQGSPLRKRVPTQPAPGGAL